MTTGKRWYQLSLLQIMTLAAMAGVFWIMNMTTTHHVASQSIGSETSPLFVEVDEVHAGWPFAFYDGFKGYSSDGRGEPQTAVFTVGPGGIAIWALIVDLTIALVLVALAVRYIEKLNWK